MTWQGWIDMQIIFGHCKHCHLFQIERWLCLLLLKRNQQMLVLFSSGIFILFKVLINLELFQCCNLSLFFQHPKGLLNFWVSYPIWCFWICYFEKSFYFFVQTFYYLLSVCRGSRVGILFLRWCAFLFNLFLICVGGFICCLIFLFWAQGEIFYRQFQKVLLQMSSNRLGHCQSWDPNSDCSSSLVKFPWYKFSNFF